MFANHQTSEQKTLIRIFMANLHTNEKFMTVSKVFFDRYREEDCRSHGAIPDLGR